MKHYMKAALIGAAVAAVFFLLLVVGGYDNVYVETILGIVIFLVYTRTALYHKEHGKDPKSMFYSFLAFIIGLSVGYLILWLLLLAAISWFSDPRLSV